MKFICMGYMDEEAWAKIPAAEQKGMEEKCMAYDDELRRGGHFLGGEALQFGPSAVTLRMRNGQVAVTDGPFVETKEQLGGILILEARDLNHAIALMSKHPGVQIGPFEIRPSDEVFNKIIQERGEKFRQQQEETNNAG